jgi:hypothetical protein
MKSMISLISDMMATAFYANNDEDDDDPVAGRGGYN